MAVLLQVVFLLYQPSLLPPSQPPRWLLPVQLHFWRQTCPVLHSTTQSFAYVTLRDFLCQAGSFVHWCVTPR